MGENSSKIYEGANITGIARLGGRLTDGIDAQEKFRDYLAGCDIETLERHAKECLKEKKFDERGYVLQDIVNTLAGRLVLRVDFGRYRGTKKEEDNGIDGVWHTEDHDFVVEVRTKEDFSIDWKKIVKYRDQLLQEDMIDSKKHSFLLVMGEMEKEALVAQVRGLPRAWDARIITVGSLIQLVKLKHKNSLGLSDDYFHDILQPLDYICVDGLVTLLDEIVSDVTGKDEETNKEAGEIQETEKSTQPSKSHEPEDAGHRDRIIATIQKETGGNLVQNRKTRFENSKTGELYFISFSKKYGDNQNFGYWYGYNYDPNSEKENTGFLILCTKEPNDWFYRIPVGTIEKLAVEGKLNCTDYEKFRCVHLHMEASNGQLMLKLRRGHGEEDIEQYKVSLVS